MSDDKLLFWMPVRDGGTFDLHNAIGCKTTVIFKNKEDAVEFCRMYSDGTEVIRGVNIITVDGLGDPSTTPAPAAKGRG